MTAVILVAAVQGCVAVHAPAAQRAEPWARLCATDVDIPGLDVARLHQGRAEATDAVRLFEGLPDSLKTESGLATFIRDWVGGNDRDSDSLSLLLLERIAVLGNQPATNPYVPGLAVGLLSRTDSGRELLAGLLEAIWSHVDGEPRQALLSSAPIVAALRGDGIRLSVPTQRLVVSSFCRTLAISGVLASSSVESTGVAVTDLRGLSLSMAYLQAKIIGMLLAQGQPLDVSLVREGLSEAATRNSYYRFVLAEVTARQ